MAQGIWQICPLLRKIGVCQNWFLDGEVPQPSSHKKQLRPLYRYLWNWHSISQHPTPQQPRSYKLLKAVYNILKYSRKWLVKRSNKNIQIYNSQWWNTKQRKFSIGMRLVPVTSLFLFTFQFLRFVAIIIATYHLAHLAPLIDWESSTEQNIQTVGEIYYFVTWGDCSRRRGKAFL